VGDSAAGQSSDRGWGARLVGKPLYLRGFWSADKLEFDGAGKLLSDSPVGPLTLSGVEVKSVAIEGESLIVHGDRVALVARDDGNPGLERRVIASTTRIWPSLRQGDKNKFHAPEEMTIRIQPDSTGDFKTAVTAIFADGLGELASAVPLYWKCYAANYFVPTVVADDAEKKVSQCVSTRADGSDEDANGAHTAPAGGSVTPPSMSVSTAPKYSIVARELMVHGVAVIHVRVGTDGVPVGLQVVRALGAGLDELALQAASQDRFRPATQDGIAVPVNMNIQVSFELHP
jgi:TonB family protein